MANASFRFYEELNDFLAPALRGRTFARPCAADATVKHMIEALGVPHTEVELILVNGESVGFGQRLGEGDRVSVYPVFEALDITPVLRVRAKPLRVTRFIADAHLGALARLLRMLGFDTRFDNPVDDADVERIAAAERRIVLTRDRELLMRRTITHGCYVRAQAPKAQCREIVTRLDLQRQARPLSRCLECNALLQPLARDDAIARVPPAVAARLSRFSTCAGCDRVYWEGSHWLHMRAQVATLLADGEAEAGGE